MSGSNVGWCRASARPTTHDWGASLTLDTTLRKSPEFMIFRANRIGAIHERPN